jgi:ABC-type uncharacterized transport system permease subunit
VAIAVVIIGRWTPIGALAGALLFAGFESFSLRAQSRPPGWPSEAFSMLPYLVTLLVLVVTARADAAPASSAAALRLTCLRLRGRTRQRGRRGADVRRIVVLNPGPYQQLTL